MPPRYRVQMVLMSSLGVIVTPKATHENILLGRRDMPKLENKDGAGYEGVNVRCCVLQTKSVHLLFMRR